MRKIISILIFIAIFMCPIFSIGNISKVFGAPPLSSDIKTLTDEAIAKLSDKDLLGTYVDVSVEIEAQKVLHATSGFLPDDLKSFKNLLRYRIALIGEMKKRKIEVPQVN